MAEEKEGAARNDHADPVWRRYEFLLKELEIMQEVIARHEKHAFSVKALLSAVLTGLAAMAFALKNNLEPLTFALLGGTAVAAFGLWAVSHKVVVERAIARAQVLQKQYLNGTSTDATTVTDHLTSGWLYLLNPQNLKSVAKASLHPTNLLPFAIAALVVWTIYSLKVEMRVEASGNGAELFSLTASEAGFAVDVADMKCRFHFKRSQTVAEGQWVLVQHDCRDK